jgi:uncharacterized protein YcfJ
MSRRTRAIVAAAGLFLGSGAAIAGDRFDDNYDFAPVVNVEPLRRQLRVSEPVRECWQEESRYASDGPFSANHVGATLLGSAIGIALGNQVGHGRGKDVARVAGAVIGGAIGHNVSVDRARQRYSDARSVERCDVSYRDRYEERIDGYRVTYEYAGRQYVTRMPYDPGERIRVQVAVTPT